MRSPPGLTKTVGHSCVTSMAGDVTTGQVPVEFADTFVPVQRSLAVTASEKVTEQPPAAGSAKLPVKSAEAPGARSAAVKTVAAVLAALPILPEASQVARPP